MAFFALLSGYFFYVYVALFVTRGMESQMMGRGMPMDVNEWVVRPALMNVSVIGLFLIPLITMRIFAEEKARGTMELLSTSPVRDGEIIFGKWLAALTMYAAILAIALLNVLVLFFYGKPELARFSLDFSVCCFRAERCWRSEHSSRRPQGIRLSRRSRRSPSA